METRKLAEITPYDRNPRKNDGAVDRVLESLNRHGQVKPIVLSAKGKPFAQETVVAGHTTLRALERFGAKEAFVVVKEFADEAQFVDYNLRDNKTSEFAEWDEQELANLSAEFDISLDEMGFEDFDIEEESEGNTDEDAVPEVPEEPTAKLGQMWKLGSHRLMCGDSTDRAQVEALMNGEKADMVFTDPPYNIGFKPQRGTHDEIMNDNMGEAEFESFLGEIFSRCDEVLKDDSVLISFMGWSTIAEFQKVLRGRFQIKSMPIWVKNNFGIGYFTRPKHEPSFLCLKGKPEKPKVAPADVFECAKVHKTVHSCEKPVDLILSMIEPFSKSGSVFYEPFGGSGSTLIACEKTKRKCRMMELDPKYIDVIIERWQNFTGKKAELIES
jgi:DNA modification methylase